MLYRDCPTLVPVLFSFGDLLDEGPQPWFVDAFLDRGKNHQEDRLQLLMSSPHHLQLFSHPNTKSNRAIDTWRCYSERTSSLILMGKLAIKASPFPGVSIHDILKTLNAVVTDPARAWGRLAAAELPKPGPFCLTDSCIFPSLPFANLPTVRDVLADPSDATLLPLEALRAALTTLEPERQHTARLMPVATHAINAQASAHLRLAVVHDVHTGLAIALAQHAAMRQGHNATAKALVAMPVYARPITIPRNGLV